MDTRRAVDAQRAQLSRGVRAYLEESARVKERTKEACVEAIVDAAEAIVRALRNGGKLLVCGNGGSAADSQHFAAELVSALDKRRRRPALPAIALTTDTSILTAISNDFGYNSVFERQVEALGRPGDVLLGISTSGASESVIRAFELARGKQIATVALTGGSGGRLKEIADVAICIPDEDVQHIQEAHLAVEHILAWLTEEQFSSESEP